MNGLTGRTTWFSGYGKFKTSLEKILATRHPTVVPRFIRALLIHSELWRPCCDTPIIVLQYGSTDHMGQVFT